MSANATCLPESCRSAPLSHYRRSAAGCAENPVVIIVVRQTGDSGRSSLDRRKMPSLIPIGDYHVFSDSSRRAAGAQTRPCRFRPIADVCCIVHVGSRVSEEAIENELPDGPSKPDASHCRVRDATDDRRGAGLSGKIRRDYRSSPLVAGPYGRSNVRSPLPSRRALLTVTSNRLAELKVDGIRYL